MKTFREHLKKLPESRRTRIEAAARHKIAAIRLQQAREQVGVTQEELAERLHMSQPALSRFERRPNITMSVLRRYVEALGGRLEINLLMPQSGPDGRRPAARGKAVPRRIPLVSA